jgi:hypothetical protein
MVIGRLRGNLLPVLASDKLHLLIRALDFRVNLPRLWGRAIRFIP